MPRAGQTLMVVSLSLPLPSALHSVLSAELCLMAELLQPRLGKGGRSAGPGPKGHVRKAQKRSLEPPLEDLPSLAC